MNTRLDRGFGFVRWATVFCVVAMAAAVVGQEPPATPAAAPPVVEPTAPPPAAETETEAGARIIREQSIYIPYEKLRTVFEREGRGVFLPYEKFQELWKAARDKTLPPGEAKPPVGALLTEVENEATVAKDVVQVKAKVKIDLLSEGWHEIPLRLADAAITRSTLAGAPARIVPDEKEGYKLLVEKKGKDPESIELELEYAKAITTAPGQNSVSFEAPRAPVSRWRVRIPESGVKVNIQPMIAASETPAETPKPEEAPKPGETVLLAFVGAAPTVRIDWTPKAEGATGLEALASAEVQLQVWLNEGVARTQARLTYAINRAKLPALSIEVPADQKIVNVSDPNVRQWSVEQADKIQKITAQLFEPAEGAQRVTVELEKFLGEKEREVVDVPVVRALGVGTQNGVVVVQVAAGLRAEPTATSGLVQLDAGELPAPLRSAKWDFSYRYATVPYQLSLAAEKVQPRITVDSLVEARLKPERLVLAAKAVYAIERAGVFRLEWDLPEGFEVRQVTGCALPGAAEAQVDAYHLTGEKKTRLVVNLARKAMGRVGLQIELARDLNEPDLLAPTDKTANLPLAIPRVVPEGIQQESGRLVVHAPESLRVTPEDDAGVRMISLDEAMTGMVAPESKPRGPADDLKPMLTYAFTREPVRLTLSAGRRRPQVSVRQLLEARIEDDAVKYTATFYYDVLYSGVKSLRIDVPEALADRLRSRTAGIREKRLEGSPEGLPAGYNAWQFTGQTEMLGEGRIEVTWLEKIEKLGVDQPAPIVVPRLIPALADAAPVDRAWGQIVVAKAETIDVQFPEQLKGLRPIDPQHDLMPGASVADAAAAWEFQDEWDLTLTATRYELEEVKRTSIEQALARMVVTRADQVAVQIFARMRSTQQRLAVILPENVQFDSEPLRINGRPVTLERGTGGKFFIPLSGVEPEKPFVVEIRYSVASTGRELALPTFPEDPAILKVYLSAYVPEERALLDASGPWTNEIQWRFDGTLQWWRPTFPKTDDQILANVCRGVNMASEPGGGFQTDGRRYVFSTLRPVGPLSLWAVNQKLLTGVVLALVVLGGLLLLPCRIGGRALGVGLLIVVLVLVGAFWPLFAMQVLDGYFLLAVTVVLVIWAVVFFVRLSSRWTAAGPAQPQELPEAAAPPGEPVPTGQELPQQDEEKGGPNHG